jgi:hypothetical protein
MKMWFSVRIGASKFNALCSGNQFPSSGKLTSENLAGEGHSAVHRRRMGEGSKSLNFRIRSPACAPVCCDKSALLLMRGP